MLSMQVRTVSLKLPGVSEVHHQGLHEARGREEVVALVAIVIPTQAAGLPGVERGQLRKTEDRQLSPNHSRGLAQLMRSFPLNFPTGKINVYDS